MSPKCFRLIDNHMLSDEAVTNHNRSPDCSKKTRASNVLAKQANQVIGLERLLNVRLDLRLSKKG